MAEPRVIDSRLLSLQLCVPADWTDEQVLAFAEKECPAGTEKGWHIRRKADYEAAGKADPERNTCADYNGFIHIVVQV